MAKKTGTATKSPAPRKAATTAAATRSKPRTAAPAATTVASTARTSSNGSPKPQTFVLSHELIAQRAYQLWQQTGNPDEGHNWNEAERQLRAERSR